MQILSKWLMKMNGCNSSVGVLHSNYGRANTSPAVDSSKDWLEMMKFLMKQSPLTYSSAILCARPRVLPLNSSRWGSFTLAHRPFPQLNATPLSTPGESINIYAAWAGVSWLLRRILEAPLVFLSPTHQCVRWNLGCLGSCFFSFLLCRRRRHQNLVA